MNPVALMLGALAVGMVAWELTRSRREWMRAKRHMRREAHAHRGAY